LSTAVATPSAPHPGAPRPHRWTIPEYRALDKTGLFTDRKTMLIDGEILVRSLPDPPHNLSLGLADQYLRSLCPAGYHVRNQMAFDVGTENDPGPDLAVVLGSLRDYADRQATEAALIVEVADSSHGLDTTRKPELYAAAKVREYWVLDLKNRRLLVFRDPVAQPKGLGPYATRLALDSEATAAPLIAPDARVKVADLLP
jgi:Uma2 family endonuclease